VDLSWGYQLLLSENYKDHWDIYFYQIGVIYMITIVVIDELNLILISILLILFIFVLIKLL
jgi:hypothetical protein